MPPKPRSSCWWGAHIDSETARPLSKAIQWSVTPSEAVHWWVPGHVEAPDNDEDYERRRQGNAWADGYAEVATRKSACGHRVALPLSLGGAYGSRRADGLGRMEWRIHRPGYWRPPRKMDSSFEEQLTAYLEDALTLAPLHLGSGTPLSKHVAGANIRMRPRRDFGAPVIGSGGRRQHGRQGVTGESRMETSCWWSPTCQVVGHAWGNKGGTHDRAAVPWGPYVAPHVVAVLEFQRWVQVVRRFVEDL